MKTITVRSHWRRKPKLGRKKKQHAQNKKVLGMPSNYKVKSKQ